MRMIDQKNLGVTGLGLDGVEGRKHE